MDHCDGACVLSCQLEEPCDIAPASRQILVSTLDTYG